MWLPKFTISVFFKFNFSYCHHCSKLYYTNAGIQITRYTFLFSWYPASIACELLCQITGYITVQCWVLIEVLLLIFIYLYRSLLGSRRQTCFHLPVEAGVEHTRLVLVLAALSTVHSWPQISTLEVWGSNPKPAMVITCPPPRLPEIT